MTAKLLRQTKLTILLSLNAVAILIVGVMIFGAINLNGGIEFRVVQEHSDDIGGSLEELGLISPETDKLDAPVVVIGGQTTTMPSGGGQSNGGGGGNGGYVTDSSTKTGGGISNNPVASGQLWNEDAITIYQTADFDICAGGGLTGLGDMYWQSSNQSVIAGFYNTARTWLGFDATSCRYPSIVGTGTTVITAGTYDGSRHDKLTVTVIAPPIEQWKRDVLNLVNQERAKNGIAALSWGTTCEAAANTRAREIMSNYSHTRPDGSAWSTTCPIPETGGISGENLNAGNAAVSPETVVASWMASPDHRENILNPNFKYVSVGFVFDPNAQHKTYWSQYFTSY